MQKEIVIAGFGGQGIMFAGRMLAYAAMDAGMEVTFFPSYGPEMRGGTANCTVIIADEEIGAPLVRNPAAALVMNGPSMDKFEPALRSGGILIANASLINQPVERSDLDSVRIPATELAESLGDKQLANLVMLGALLPRLGMLPEGAAQRALRDHLPARHHHLLELNLQALQVGMNFVPENLVAADS